MPNTPVTQRLSSTTLENSLRALQTRWEDYASGGRFEQFVEFAVAVNCLAELFHRLRLPNLVRLCENLENATLAKFGDPSTHPVSKSDSLSLQRQMDTLLSAVAMSQPAKPPASSRLERRIDEPASAGFEIDWIKPRAIWMIVAPEKHDMAHALRLQLQFFGFKVSLTGWHDPYLNDESPLAILFVPAYDHTTSDEFTHIAAIRTHCPVSQFFYLGVQSAIEPIVALMRAGIDVTIPTDEPSSVVLNSILDLEQIGEKEHYKVLVVEDSRVAVALIQRTLAQHGIDTHAISDPATMLDVLETYRPDLILMDMCMPRFSGVEATRVLRQMATYSALPIVYLSGESTVGMQVEALRLGGDQFLTKPFNPILLAAVVKTKIVRFREMQRSTCLDGLTGLLNHTAAKSRLNALVAQMAQRSMLTVAMIDIDHFKAVNDTFGHPVGDQVIRGLAWLLKGRLRSIDLVGRYGGEEFLIALPDVTAEQALAVIDRIRTDFSTLPHTHSGGALYATFSAGVASLPMIRSATGLTEAADGALLHAKRLGRNRVERATVHPTLLTPIPHG